MPLCRGYEYLKAQSDLMQSAQEMQWAYYVSTQIGDYIIQTYSTNTRVDVLRILRGYFTKKLNK